MSLQVIKSSARKSTQLITDSHPGTSMIPVNPVSAVPAATTEVLDYDSLALEEVPVPVGQAVPFRSDDSAIGGVRGLPSLVQRAWPVSFPVDSRTEGVLSGLEAPAPQSAIGLVADELDISYSVAIGEMANLMRVALYLADGTIADLENATAPDTTATNCAVDMPAGSPMRGQLCP